MVALIPAMRAAQRMWKSYLNSVTKDIGEPNLVVYNASGRVRGPITELDPEAVRNTIMVTCYGGFLVGQAAAKRMIKAGNGTILFTGASASVKGYANSAAFAMGKLGLTGLVQSMARELQPQNIHVAQVVIDGGIIDSTPSRPSHGARSRRRARSRRDRANLSASAPPASQRVGVSHRVAAVVGKILAAERNRDGW